MVKTDCLNLYKNPTRLAAVKTISPNFSHTFGGGLNGLSELLQASDALGDGQTDSLNFYKTLTYFKVVKTDSPYFYLARPLRARKCEEARGVWGHGLPGNF